MRWAVRGLTGEHGSASLIEAKSPNHDISLKRDIFGVNHDMVLMELKIDSSSRQDIYSSLFNGFQHVRVVFDSPQYIRVLIVNKGDLLFFCM